MPEAHEKQYPGDKLFRFHWKGKQEPEEGYGRTSTDAFARLGYGGGAHRALDYHEEVRGPEEVQGNFDLSLEVFRFTTGLSTSDEEFKELCHLLDAMCDDLIQTARERIANNPLAVKCQMKVIREG